MSTEKMPEPGSRAESAQATRLRIIDAAAVLLIRGGYHSMSVSGLAKAAQVSPQTVYNAIGGKSEVVKLVYDTMLAGDDEPIAMPDRPEFKQMAAAVDRVEFVRAYARLCGVIYHRVGSLLGVLLAQGAGADPGLAEFVATIDAERRAGNTNAVTLLERTHGLPDGFRRDVFIDEVWCLTAPEVFDRFVRRCGWTHDDYGHWLERALLAAFENCSPPSEGHAVA